MRKLSREDKPKSDILVRDGGKSVQQRLYQPDTYKWTLAQAPDEFFSSKDSKVSSSKPLDGDTPILYLENSISVGNSSRQA
jgi:hypothetical protein